MYAVNNMSSMSQEKNNINYEVKGIEPAVIEMENIVQEPYSSFSSNDHESGNEGGWGNKWTRFKDSFKQAEIEELDPNLTEAERIAVATARSPLKHTLKKTTFTYDCRWWGYWYWSFCW
ncbi:hypothetical protein SEUBUCD646_0B06270 [Saccharomyces eubayanus]|uniref:Uncharacterized protein n=1 Tax=Saccharomyces eubayanus TaxID=1080349 RepID=A0ABN8VN71_SACEU|nr:hypothetical protein SEUBUCD650_0B06270 [Saccharomyces eubayanus]CAI1900351.1 hypothetical protein SEUBUCD646_0B06270 [Saccharomyces eubayanus]